MKTYTKWQTIKHYSKRFLRTFVPQIPALITLAIGVNSQYTVLATFIGACATALDKYLRDSYDWYSEYLG